MSEYKKRQPSEMTDTFGGNTTEELLVKACEETEKAAYATFSVCCVGTRFIYSAQSKLSVTSSVPLSEA